MANLSDDKETEIEVTMDALFGDGDGSQGTPEATLIQKALVKLNMAEIKAIGTVAGTLRGSAEAGARFKAAFRSLVEESGKVA